MKIEHDVVREICRRSAAGEGVSHILNSLGIDSHDGLIYLRDHHVGEITAAKKAQIESRRVAAEPRYEG